MAENVLRDRIIEIYQSGEGITGKIADLKTAFPDGEIVENIETLYDEGVLVMKSEAGSGKEAFLERDESEQEVAIVRLEALECKE